MAHILIVDPDAPHARRNATLLRAQGWTVDVVVDAPAARRRLEGEPAPGGRADAAPAPCDLVLMDVQLGGEQGFDLCRWIRARPGPGEVPILLLTAMGNPRDISRGFQAGASDYLIKPVHLDIFMARIRGLLRLKEAQDRLQQTNEELRRVSEIKGRMVSVVSHELRTPLTSLRGALDLVGRGGEGLPPRSQRMLAIGLRNTDRLIRLVNGVLSFARLEAGLDLALQAVPLAESVTRAVEELETLAGERAIRIRVDVPTEAVAHADADRVHQVLINLLSNALRHGPEGGEVRVEVAPRGGQWRVEVIDAGPGIAAEDLPRLFQPFSQLRQGDGAPAAGTGLGLAICREIVERHGGSIGVESVPGEGSRFWFTLPGAEGPSG